MRKESVQRSCRGPICRQFKGHAKSGRKHRRKAARQERAQKRGGGELVLVLDELSEVIPDESEEDSLAVKELSKHINSFLRSLPLETRRVFIKRYWHMASVSDISKDFSISESKVKSMLFRTREKLRQYLIKEGIKL